jgi:hypothetical protein
VDASICFGSILSGTQSGRKGSRQQRVYVLARDKPTQSLPAERSSRDCYDECDGTNPTSHFFITSFAIISGWANGVAQPRAGFRCGPLGGDRPGPAARSNEKRSRRRAKGVQPHHDQSPMTKRTQQVDLSPEPQMDQ